MVNGTNNKSYNRQRCIKRSEFLAKISIVFFQKVFIKMNYRVWTFMSLPPQINFKIFLHKLLNICTRENFTEFIHNIFKSLIKIWSNYMIKKMPKKRIRCRNKIACFLAGKVIWRIIIIAGDKKTIYKRLCIHVGK